MSQIAGTLNFTTLRFARWPFGRSRPAHAAALLGMLLTTGRAEAEEHLTVATVSPILHDGLPDQDRALFARRFDKALHGLQLANAGNADSCLTEACWQELAQTQHADLVAFYCAAGDPQSGLCDPRRNVRSSSIQEPAPTNAMRNYRFAVVVYSSLRKTVTTASAGCDGCIVSEAADRLQGLTETLIQDASRADALGTVTLRNAPPESLVFVDGVLRAQSAERPITIAVPANETHAVTIHPVRQQSHHVSAVRVQPGETLTLDLPPLAERKDRDSDDTDSPPPPSSGYMYPTKPPTWRWALPLVLIGAGGLMLGLGARAYSIKGTCSDQMGCPMTYNTEQVGMGLLGVGGALVGIGGITLAFGVQKVYVRVPPSSSD